MVHEQCTFLVVVLVACLEGYLNGKFLGRSPHALLQRQASSWFTSRFCFMPSVISLWSDLGFIYLDVFTVVCFSRLVGGYFQCAFK